MKEIPHVNSQLEIQIPCIINCNGDSNIILHKASFQIYKNVKEFETYLYINLKVLKNI